MKEMEKRNRSSAPDSCVLCQLVTADDHEAGTIHNRIWYAFGERLNVEDAYHVAMKNGVEAPREIIQEHLLHHAYEQPQAQGKYKSDRALQEVISTFPEYYYWILRTLYRFKALSEKQIKRIFYEPYYEAPGESDQRFEEDFTRLIFRSFLLKHNITSKGALLYEDEGPYYFLNRQAIPVVENLEKTTLSPKLYTTRSSQVEEFHLEEDSRLNECFTALRTSLYNRSFKIGKRDISLHLSVENVHTSKRMHWLLPKTKKSEAEMFAPSLFAALRMEDNDALSVLLPFFFEYDRGTKSIAAVVEKLINYFRFFASEVYEQALPALSDEKHYPPVFVVVDTPFRAAEIIRQVEARVGPRPLALYFCDYETFKHDPWASGIWRAINTDENERFGFLARLLFHSQKLTQSRALHGRDRIMLGEVTTSQPKGASDKTLPDPEVEVKDIDAATNLEDLL